MLLHRMMDGGEIKVYNTCKREDELMHLFSEVGSSGRILGKSKNCSDEATIDKIPRVGTIVGPCVLNVNFVNY